MVMIDWAVIGLYLVVLLVLAVFHGRGQHNVQDYYLAGRKIKWWQSGSSTMATQLGAISFVSAPAFVAMKENGGLKWLCYEFGVPLGILIVMFIIIPILHQRNYISIYEYLEKRFDRGVRTLVSLLFQLGRGLATAVSILAGGLILSTALPFTTAQAILIVGAVTILYDVIGGIRIVILSDLMQMVVIIFGLAICGYTAYQLVGWNAAWQALEPGRFAILDFKQWGLTTEGSYSFWPMTVGGIFLYASYYGCDQSQVQRELSVSTGEEVQKSLMINSFGRFPVVLLYCLMGVFVGAVFVQPEFMQQIAAKQGITTAGLKELLQSDPDRMVPLFILTFLPAGVVGFIFVAIMSALMSSLDSSINSLSAVTMEDVYKRYFKPDANGKHYLVMSKIFTLFWGVFCIIAALVFSGAGETSRQTTIVLINAIGSLLYGPILAAFVSGMLLKNSTASGIKAGITVGIVVNILLWQLTDISWLWWNLTGFLVTILTATTFSVGRLRPGKIISLEPGLKVARPVFKKNWRKSFYLVIFYFFLIIGFAWLIQSSVKLHENIY